jgi:hypothetical protein
LWLSSFWLWAWRCSWRGFMAATFQDSDRFLSAISILMPRITALDRQWDELMFLCTKEKDLLGAGKHPKVLKLVGSRIDELAGQMGFSPRQIKIREFRSEKQAGHIVRIVTD